MITQLLPEKKFFMLSTKIVEGIKKLELQFNKLFFTSDATGK
jgi:hypothetical protein